MGSRSEPPTIRRYSQHLESGSMKVSVLGRAGRSLIDLTGAKFERFISERSEP